jgi:hypothetical protein
MRIPKIKKESIKDLIIIIPLLIIIIPIVIILSPYFIVDSFLSDKKRKKLAKEFWMTNKDKYFFFYSSKHSWGDFVINNIIPVLPENTTAYNVYKDKPNPIHTINDILGIAKISWHDIKLPMIIKLTEHTPIVFSLNDDYNKTKNNGKRDIEVQKEIEIKIKERFS